MLVLLDTRREGTARHSTRRDGSKRDEKRRLTSDKSIRYDVEHRRVEVGVESKVARGVVSGGDEHGVSLSDREGEIIDGELIEVGLSCESDQEEQFRAGRRKGSYTISFDQTHLVSIEPGVEHGERAGVDNSESVGLSSFKRDRRVLVEPGKVFALVRDVDQRRVWRDNMSVCIIRREGKGTHWERAQLRSGCIC